MNRKTVILYSTVAVILLFGIGLLFHSLFKDNGSDDPYIPISEGVSAIPSDAVILFESDKLETIIKYTERGGAFETFSRMLPDDSNSWDAIYSLHYSSKNRVSPLLVISIPQGTDASLLISSIERECSGVESRKYGDNLTYRSTVPDISFAVCGNFVIVSDSQVVLESSLRHIENRTSIADTPLYGSVPGVKHNNEVLHINHENMGKIFSSYVDRNYLGYADFARNFANWSTFSVENGQGKISIDGKFNAASGEKNFANLFLTQKESKSDIYSLIPNHCRYMFLISMSDSKGYTDSYTDYLETIRGSKAKDYVFLNAMAKKSISSDTTTFQLLEMLQIKQLALFAFDINGEEKRVLAVRSENHSPMGNVTDTIADFRYKGYLDLPFGDFFKPTSQEKYCMTKDWIFVGGDAEIEYLYREHKNEFMFNLNDYLTQTPASDHLERSAVFSAYINFNRYSDSLSRFFKSPYDKRLNEDWKKKNFECATLLLNHKGGILESSLDIYSEELSTEPTPLRVPELDQFVELDDTPVEVFAGPFVVKDFRDGSTNYLEQRPNNSLRLLNSAKRGLWTVQFDTPLCGYVEQIDYLKNGKLQMLFCSSDKLYLLDRLGRKVGKFPISLGKEVLLGPNVYDFKGNKEYVVMVLHTDNTIAMYNLDGSKYHLWNDILLSERVVSMPQLLLVGNNRYWVVRTAYQTLIYNSEGTLAAEFTKKRRLKKDTKVEVISSNEVAVTTFEGRDMILNLDSGSFRKR